MSYYNYRDLQEVYGNPDSGSFKKNLVKYSLLGTEIKPTVHKLIVPFLDAVEYLLKERGIEYKIKYAWGFNNRNIRGGSTKSIHSYGAAIDINPPTNPMGTRLITDMPRKFVECFKEVGFEWGGDYPGRKDAMHFELLNTSLIKKRMSLEQDVKTLKGEVKSLRSELSNVKSSTVDIEEIFEDFTEDMPKQFIKDKAGKLWIKTQGGMFMKVHPKWAGMAVAKMLSHGQKVDMKKIPRKKKGVYVPKGYRKLKNKK